MANKELITKIVLKGQADSSLTKALSTVSQNSETCLNKLSVYGDKLAGVFKAAAGTITVAAGASVKAAIDFESAFAGVRKTVDETDTTTYDDLSEGIRKLATVTPAAATEIAGVAEAAGQLGIKADDILKFSKTMIDLGESTNLSAEEAATSIAKMFNITGTSMDKVDAFGSTLVALGNNAATTESDILAMATRIAGSGKQIGLTEQQILALSTSLSSVGIEAEMGGSAISTTMTQIDKAVALNSESLEIWAKTAGMSTAEFSNAWKSNAYGALQKVIEGMGKTKDEGGNLNVLLEDLGINAIRQGDMLKRLSGASELMADMTNLANKAWEENSALSKEANTRYATTASRIQILKNKITDVGITIGNALLPVVNKIIKKMDEINWDEVAAKIVSKIQWVIDNFDKVKVGLGILAGAFAAFKIGGFINTMSGAVKEIKMLSEITGVTAKLGQLKTSLKGLNLGSVVTSFKGLGTAVMGVGAPILAVVAVIAVLGAAFATLWKTNDEFRNKMTEIWNSIKDKVSGFCDGIVERINSLGFDFGSITEVLKSIWMGFCDFLAPIFEGVFQQISNVLGACLDNILNVIDLFIALFKGDWSGCWEAIKSIGETTWNLMVSTFQTACDMLKGVADVVLGWFGTSWDKCWSAIKKFSVSTWNNIVAFFKSTFNSMKSGFSNFISSVKDFFVNGWNNIVAFCKNTFNSIKTSASNFITAVINFFAKLPSSIANIFTNVYNSVVAWGANMWAKATEIGANFVNGVVEFFSELPYKIGYVIGFVIGKIVDFKLRLHTFATVDIPQFINKVVEWFSQLPSRVGTWIENTWQKFITWGSNMLAKAQEVGSNVINSISTFFSQLPSKIWTALTNAYNKVVTWGANVLSVGKQKASEFITSVISFFSQLAGKIGTALTNAYNKVVAWGTNVVSTAKQKASEFINSVITFFSQLPSKVWIWLSNTANKVVTWGTELAAKGKKAATDLLNAIVNKVQEIPGKMLSIGSDIVAGLWEGIGNAKDWLMDKISSFADGITDGIAAALGIASPSVVMEKLAKWVPVGFGNGIINNAKYAIDAVKGMGSKLVDTASRIHPAISVGTTGSIAANLPKFGNGGTVTRPQAAIVGDRAETIVPHGNTPRNRALLSEAAAGVGSRGGGNVFNVTFAPVLSGGNVEENRQMLLEQEELFERRLEEFFEKKARLAF